jgi:CRP-like cAMP-binding protein
MSTFPALIERMKRITHFRGIADKDLLQILRAGQLKRYSAGTTIFMEGDPCFGLCVLFRGEVHLYKLGPEGQENILSVIEPVIMFNEIAVIDGGPNPMTAVAFKNCVIWRADYETFQYGLERFPNLGLGLLPVLARRSRRLISKYANLSFLPVRERVAVLLLELSSHGQESINRREHTIQQMAAHIATVPVVISRTLSGFKEDGIIDCTRTKISVIEPAELAQIALLEMDSM